MRFSRVLAAALLALASCTDSSTEPLPSPPKQKVRKTARAQPQRTPAPAPHESTEVLVYARGSRLETWNLDLEVRTILGPIPTPDAVLSPDGESVAVVRDLAPGSDPEGYGDPEIVTGPLGGALNPVGPGSSPLWSPNGKQIAVTDDSGVVVYEVASGGSETVLDGNRWDLIGWTSDGVLAIGAEGAAIGSPGGSPEFLSASPSSLWGISPTSRTILSVEGSNALFSRLEDGGEVSTELSTALGEGAWAPDGSRVALIEIKGGSRMRLVEKQTGRVLDFSEGKGGQGGVVWSEDSDTFAFARIDPDNKLSLQAVICTIELDCETAFSWSQGVRLLGFASITD